MWPHRQDVRSLGPVAFLPQGGCYHSGHFLSVKACSGHTHRNGSNLCWASPLCHQCPFPLARSTPFDWQEITFPRSQLCVVGGIDPPPTSRVSRDELELKTTHLLTVVKKVFHSVRTKEVESCLPVFVGRWCLFPLCVLLKRPFLLSWVIGCRDI